jgi:tetratricopeptide (TPR) repeat protein
VSDPAQARVYLDRAFALAKDIDDPELEARLYCESGRNYLYDGQFDKAIVVLEKALAIFEELEHLPGQALVFSRLAPAYAEAYNLGPALICDRRALDLYMQINNHTKLCRAHNNLAETYVLLGAYEQAKDHTLKSLEISRRQGNKVNEINTLSVYATILGRLGQIEEAEKLYQTAIAAQKALKLNSFLSFSLLDWGDFQLRTGRLVEAEITFDEAITINGDIPHLRVTSQAKQAMVYLAQGKSRAALTLADKVWQALEPTGGKDLPLPVNTMYACYSIFQACDDDRAGAALQMAADVLKQTAAEIEDPEMRTTFLNNVPVNRQLQAALHEDAVETVRI